MSAEQVRAPAASPQQLLEATRGALKSEHRDDLVGGVIDRLGDPRHDVAADPTTLWTNTLRAELTPQQWRLVEAAVRKAASNMGSYLHRQA